MSPDISMCVDKECPSKEDCYRYTAKPSHYRQSYMNPERNKDDKKCEYFIDNRWEEKI